MGVVDDELKLHGIDGLRVLNAGSYLDQHQRADDHDRREGCGNHQRYGAAKTGGVTKARALSALRLLELVRLTDWVGPAHAQPIAVKLGRA